MNGVFVTNPIFLRLRLGAFVLLLYPCMFRDPNDSCEDGSASHPGMLGSLVTGV